MPDKNKCSDKICLSTIIGNDIFWYCFYFLAWCSIFLWKAASYPIWVDEVFTLYQVDDKSFEEMIRSFEGGVNAIPYLYFVVIWAIGVLIRHTVITLRLISTFFTIMSVIVMHNLIKRIYSTDIAVVSVISILLISDVSIYEALDARPYTMYLLTIIVLVYITYNFLNKQYARRQYWQIVIGTALVVCTHYFGLIYAGIIMVCVLWSIWFYEKRIDMKTVLAFFAGFLISIIIHYDQLLLFVGNKGLVDPNWMGIPNLYGLRWTYSQLGIVKVIVSALLAVVLTLAIPKSGSMSVDDSRKTGNFPEMLNMSRGEAFIFSVSAGFILIPCIFYALSGIKNVFLLRYFFPTLIASTFLVALALGRIKRAIPPDIIKKCRTVILAFVCISFAALTAFEVKVAIANGRYYYDNDLLNINMKKELSTKYSLHDVQSRIIVTNNMHVYFPLTYYYGDHFKIAIVRRTAGEIIKMAIFNRNLHGMLPSDLLNLTSFIFINLRWKWDPNSFPEFDILEWAAQNSYECAELGKDTYVVSRR